MYKINTLEDHHRAIHFMEKNLFEKLCVRDIAQYCMLSASGLEKIFQKHEKKGVKRFGQASVPLDEALCEVVIDLSGRPFLLFDMSFTRERIGELDTELVEEFFRALSISALMTIHLKKETGHNTHHMIEAGFKALARALRMAVEIDPRAQDEIPSTKGVL